MAEINNPATRKSVKSPRQMPILRGMLDEFGVINKFSVYPGGHGWNWSDANKEDLRVQISQFFLDHW